jgi:hypothetical protein
MSQDPWWEDARAGRGNTTDHPLYRTGYAFGASDAHGEGYDAGVADALRAILTMLDEECDFARSLIPDADDLRRLSSNDAARDVGYVEGGVDALRDAMRYVEGMLNND